MNADQIKTTFAPNQGRGKGNDAVRQLTVGTTTLGTTKKMRGETSTRLEVRPGKKMTFSRFLFVPSSDLRKLGVGQRSEWGHKHLVAKVAEQLTELRLWTVIEGMNATSKTPKVDAVADQLAEEQSEAEALDEAGRADGIDDALFDQLDADLA